MHFLDHSNIQIYKAMQIIFCELFIFKNKITTMFFCLYGLTDGWKMMNIHVIKLQI